MNPLVDFDEIEDLMKMDGKLLTLMIPDGVTPTNSDLGIAGKSKFKSKEVIGYLVNQKNIQINITGGSTQKGDQTARISARSIAKEDIKPGTLLAYDSFRFHVDYAFSVTVEGEIMMHELRLTAIR